MAGGSATRPRTLHVLVTALVATFALLPATAGARTALTRVGRLAPRPARAVLEGPLPAANRLHLDIALAPRNPAALAAYARAVSTPGSALYRRFLSPGEFGRRFGASPATVARVARALRTRGLRPGAPSAGRLSIPVTASAATLERAFAVSLRQLSLNGRRTAVAASAPPALPAAVARSVQGVLGLDGTPAPRPLLVRAPSRAAGAPSPLPGTRSARAAAAGTGPHPCAAAQAAAPGQSAYTEDQIAAAYGFSGVYAAGDTGAGVTVAVYELEPDDDADLAAYQSCYGTHATIEYVPVDGGAGSGPGSGEAALDIENLIGLAPDAHVLVYQGPNSSSNDPGSGPYDTFSKIVNQDRARVVTVSWGQCESGVGQADAAAENTLFQQAAAQGQSIVAADGDSGVEDCQTSAGLPEPRASVDDPSSQPFVTGVGGTSLRALGPRPQETVWNTGGQTLAPTEQPGAGGGGVSSFWAMPSAQLNAKSALGVRTASPGQTACGNAGGYCREVPDVSADADPGTGYLIYWNGGGTVPGQPAGWQGIGGTSAAAPLWAALLTLADGSAACAGSAVGDANPALYRAAGSAYSGDFNDVTSGENDFTGANGGRYPAAVGYDLASGLGTPNAGSLIGGLCANTVRLTVPATQRSALHAAVTARLRALDTAGEAVSYNAVGLPPGIALNHATGRLSGRPKHTGRFTVTVTAHDRESSSSAQRFTWIVGPAPRISRVSLAAVTGGSRLALTISAGRGAPQLKTLAIALPRQLRPAASRRGITVGGTGSRPPRVRFSHTFSRGTLTIRLRAPEASVRVLLSPPTLRGRLPVPVRRANSPKGALTSHGRLPVAVTDAGAGRSTIFANVTESSR